MAAGEHRLSFERPIYELEAQLDKLEKLALQHPDARTEITRLRRELGLIPPDAAACIAATLASGSAAKS